MQKGQGEGAVLYVRVSTDDQAQGPFNLRNQEKRCIEYCDQHGWCVIGTFIDPGESARTVERPEFQRMLDYCRANRRKVKYVVVSDLSRFARNNEDQARTITALGRIGVGLRSTYESNIDDTAAGKLAANIFGTFNQFFSDALSEKMQERTRQAVSVGRFPWRAPIGYRNIGGKVGANIEPNEEQAPYIRRAFDLIAGGRYRKTDVLKMVTDGGLTTSKGKALTPQTFQAVLRNRLYAGWVTLPSDEHYEPVRGLHEPLVTQETFNRVQAVLDGRKPNSAPRRKVNPEFPLKFIRCGECETPLTGAFCKGRRRTYPRYWCPNGRCKAVKLGREQLDLEFNTLLRQMRPRPEVVGNFPKIAAKAWAMKQGDSEKNLGKLQSRLNEQKRRRHRLVESMLDGTLSRETFIEIDNTYKAEIDVIEEELKAHEAQQGTQSAFLRFAEIHLMDLPRAWEIAGAEQRQRVQSLLFDGALAYSPRLGILNRSKASLYSALATIRDEKDLLASPTGFEPVLPP